MPAPNKGYRKLTKLGKGSYYVLIPPQMVRELEWQERQKLRVRRYGKKVIIEDWQRPA